MKRPKAPMRGMVSPTGERRKHMPSNKPVKSGPVAKDTARPARSSNDLDSDAKPRLRSDLNFVHEGARPDPEGRKLPAALRVIDPRNDRQHEFTPEEHVLCRAADGQTTIAEMQKRIKAMSGKVMSHDEISRFFRRLKVRGLLETKKTQAAVTKDASLLSSAAKDATKPAADTKGKDKVDTRPKRFGAPRASGLSEQAPEVVAEPTNATPATELKGADAPKEAAAQVEKVSPPKASTAKEPVVEPATKAVAPVVPPVAPTQAENRATKVEPPTKEPSKSEVKADSTSADQPKATKPPAATVPEKTAKEPKESKAKPASGGKAKAPVQEKPASEPEVIPPSVRPFAGRRGPLQGRGAKAAAAAAAAGPRLVSQREMASKSDSAKPVETTESNVTPGRFGQARFASSNAEFAEVRNKKMPDVGRDAWPPARDSAKEKTVSAARRRAADADEDLLDLFDDEAPAGAGRQRRGPAGGMMGGGMMGGMGGIMGGGGMMGGGGGGMMGGGMMGGMGGMMGGRGQAAQPEAPTKSGPAQFPLFNPTGLLKLLYVVGWPFKFILWAIVPLVVIAGLSMIHNLTALFEDIATMLGNYSFITKFLMALVLVNLGSRLAQGVAIIAHGGKVQTLGINLVVGLVPRFYVDTSDVEKLNRTGQLWAHGSPLLARLFAFVGGIIVWAMTHDQGGSLPLIALVVAKFGLVMFAFTSWPFLPADGMRWFAALFNEPKLMPKAVMAFRHVVFKRQLPPMMDRSELGPLMFFAVGALLSTLLILGVGIVLLFGSLEQSMGGTGVLLFFGFVAIATMWFMALVRGNRAKFKGMGKMGQGMGAMAAPEMGRADPKAKTKTKTDADAEKDVPLPNRARVVWAMMLCGLLIVAFMPYNYETGGETEILPMARGQAVARTDGEIVEVLVTEGDAVEEGQVLAVLSDWDQISDIAIAEARLTGAQAELKRLEAGAQPEEVELARAQLRRAEAALAYKEAEVERNRELINSQTVSQASLERAEADYASALAELEYARASLALVESGATAEELEIVQADVQRLERELAFDRDELQRTRIVAPISGYVVTADLQLKRGDYLREGELLLEIEQSQAVTVAIAVPEADASLVEPGQQVRMRLRSASDEEILGTVKSVAPAAEDLGYGRIVRAMAEFPNDDGRLRSAMTGRAKIDNIEMHVWEAYLRSVQRFIQIDVWSWIP